MNSFFAPLPDLAADHLLVVPYYHLGTILVHYGIALLHLEE